MDEQPTWTTPSSLAEYVYCPRAHYYRLHAEAPPTREASAGEEFHRRQLSSERWRDEHRRLPWVAVVLGVGLLVVAGLVWIL